jgi:ABC-type transport system involved in multi-copper enzyme maturation permease subunit
MLNLIRAEWFKLSRRPMTWVLLAVFLALLVLLRLTEFLMLALHDGLFSGGQVRLSLLREEQVAQFRLQLSFPGIFGAVLSHVNGVGGICAIVLAAGAMGSEYSWGTLRAQLARQPNRGRYLVAKIVALLLILLCGMAIGLLAGALLALLLSSLLGNVGMATAGDLLRLPLGMLRSLYVMLPYIMLTIAGCILGRSVLAGAAGGFLFLVVDVGLGALSFLSQLGGLLRLLVNLAVQPNVNTLIVLNSQSFGLNPAILTRTMDLATLPSPLQATLVIAAYSALFFAYAYQSLLRRYFTGAVCGQDSVEIMIHYHCGS